jgi:hypothetical protein
MKKKTFILIFISVLITVSQSYAQMLKRPTKKVYVSTDFDIFLLSSSIKEQAGSKKLTTPRFSAIPFLGFNVNYDFAKNVGLYTGVNIKNIGFIEKFSDPDFTVKRRVYTIGAPLGLKIGDIKYGSYLILGIGADFPIHYKEKSYIKRNDKTKYNEWFSDATPRIMPYAFVGVHLMPVFTFKVQYYPTNFLNPDYTVADAWGKLYYPYKDYYVPTIMLTAGIDIPFFPKD